jgi:methylated-DNA-[protein]-cysteine S-methyltransferase
MLHFEIYKSPMGPVGLLADGEGLLRCDFQDGLRPVIPPEHVNGPNAVTRQAREQLIAYFTGQCAALNIPLKLSATPFQEQVWQAISAIPAGQTYSYSQLATELNKPRAVRAVASACARNPVCIFIPCHRILNKQGALTGYVSGLAFKQQLLNLEKSYV